jgi:hypothetical protein
MSPYSSDDSGHKMVHCLIEQQLETSGAYSSQSLNKLKTVIT